MGLIAHSSVHVYYFQISSTKQKNYKLTQAYFTFPKMGRSTDPHVSAPQWTSPDAKSAVSIPATEDKLEE